MGTPVSTYVASAVTGRATNCDVPRGEMTVLTKLNYITLHQNSISHSHIGQHLYYISANTKCTKRFLNVHEQAFAKRTHKAYPIILSISGNFIIALEYLFCEVLIT